MKFSSVLVTGGAGFIGSHIVDALLSRGARVGVLDNMSTGARKNLPRESPYLRIHVGDICDQEFVRRSVEGYDAVVHEAAMVSVTRSVEDPARTNAVNVGGTVNVLVAARDAGVKRVVYSSSSSVYGESEVLPKVESMLARPVSPYGVSKLAAENYCRVFADVYGLPTISLRYFNVYGPRQMPGPYSGVIPAFVKRVMEGRPPIIYGDGLQTRDFTYVEDVVTANLLSLEISTPSGDIFNVSSGRRVTLIGLANTVARLMDRPSLGVEYTPPRQGDIRHSLADISKARAVLGYSPEFTLEEGLRHAIDFFCHTENSG